MKEEAQGDLLSLAGRTFGSRLIVGTGKFSSPEVMADALAASGTEMVTVAVRLRQFARGHLGLVPKHHPEPHKHQRPGIRRAV